MLNFGIVGTSDISHRFIEAAHLSGHYQLQAVFSRKLETAATFSEQYEGVDLYTEWVKFISAPIDVVYIASPNALHFEQAKAVLAAGKHAIVEKPMVSTPQELEQLRRVAQENNVFLFEAARNYHEQAQAIIREFLTDKTILGGSFGYAKYSSKMPELLAGQMPNIFSTDFSGGALMDLGVYTLYAAIGILGTPRTARYVAQQLPSSIDLNGSGQLIYDNYIVHIQAGKNITSNLASEIYTNDGTLTLNACQHISSAIFTKHDGEQIVLPIQAVQHPMLEEALEIAQAIKQQNRELVDQWLAVAESVHQTLYTMRQDAGIIFKADNNEI
ncbi:Gfo/Idh/MocA family oxidoreductase [Streptococcus suis]|uniref:Gfo/Idh/MocA family oxidoreductase n=1 Tax=Streptococcus suis TaxID=1307 RepID=A0A4T2H9D5_STRSU|nr:Gfo/Idh/MocA family oxidoreductase [Streptococcus suis]MCK4004881.1 Gfo/Idh/MocA family oxidoreductase [Streptococcus suis]TII08859.1 Gfo/Idh/MocA family oxidoreductase [Streptococcus suis]HEM3568848.1 Gfo/Idh/MocA family oxidoreductase [Streptococcus suis]HEM4483939.1 Gfo/Idh/MocA family oxidoreductase [Streptococcus suis]